MSEIIRQITPHYCGECHCAQFLAHIKTWKEVATRHAEIKQFITSLVIISDTREDWVIDLLRCTDCGRYWAREFVSRRDGYFILYHVEDKDPDKWLDHHRFWGGVLWSLKKHKDSDYETYVAPYLIR